MTGKEKYDEYFKALDDCIEAAVPAIEAAGMKITCRKEGAGGCNGCCYVQNFVADHEVARALHGMSPEDKAYVAQQTRAWVDKVKPSKFMNIKDEEDFNAAEFMQLNAACPFLRDGKCMVYAARPFNCRVHLAIKDPDLCKSPETQADQYFVRWPNDWDGYYFVLHTALLAGGSAVMDLIGFHLARVLLGEHHPTACLKQLNLKKEQETVEV